ncbi:MAG: hypothetical protein O7G86_00250 [Gammaproteobacteria bacterium]|nr:hypothetical protein [Gammaproteobacteria bacterium]
MRKCLFVITTLLIGVCLFGADVAYAVKLEVDADASRWAHIGAGVLLYLHIGGGAIGLVAGSTASLVRKGGVVHRAAGKVFLGSMFIAYVIGAGVAPFLSEGQRPNFVAGILALYLLITGVLAAKRRNFQASRAEYVGLVIALTITALGVLFAVMGANSESGTVDGSPPQAFYLFVIAGLAAAGGELNVIIKRSLSEVARKSRHLWRMCVSFFFASGSLFLGQPQVFPDWFNESIFPIFLAFIPILVMMIWLVKVRMGHNTRT